MKIFTFHLEIVDCQNRNTNEIEIHFISVYQDFSFKQAKDVRRITLSSADELKSV